MPPGHTVVTMFLLAVLGTVAFSQPSRDTSKVKIGNPELRKELLAMEASDQEVRDKLIDIFSAHPVDSLALVDVIKRTDSVDARHTKAMKEIISRDGWPGRSMVGSDGEEAAFILVQHADKDTAFQSNCLKLVEKAYKAGEASGQDLALLTDRVLVHLGKPQLYGSQVKFVNGRVVVDSIEDERNIDKRRAELGLVPMAEYLKVLRQYYHLEGK